MPKSQTKLINCEYYGWRLFRRDGVYYADGRTNRPKLGKHSLGTRDAQEARQRLRQLDRRMAVEHGLVNDLPNANATADISPEEAWKQFLEHCQRPEVVGGVSTKTVKRYRAVRDKHLQYCRKVAAPRWSDVDKSHAEDYGRYLTRKGYADRTIYLELTLLVQVTNWLISERRLPESHRFSLKLQKPTGSDTYCFTRGQVDAMLEWCRLDQELQWLRPLLATLAMTGLRIGEAQGLRWSDLDLDAGVLHVPDERASSRKKKLRSARTAKGKRGRTVPLHPALRQILQSTERQQDGFVFHGPRGGRLKQDTARNILRRDVIAPVSKRFPTPEGEIGFEHGRFHSFRHYFVSQCFAHGASEGEVKDWVGHRDSAMVGHYRHLHDDVSQQRIQRVQFVSDTGQISADGPSITPASTTKESDPPGIQPDDRALTL